MLKHLLSNTRASCSCSQVLYHPKKIMPPHPNFFLLSLPKSFSTPNSFANPHKLFCWPSPHKIPPQEIVCHPTPNVFATPLNFLLPSYHQKCFAIPAPKIFTTPHLGKIMPPPVGWVPPTCQLYVFLFPPDTSTSEGRVFKWTSLKRPPVMTTRCH